MNDRPIQSPAVVVGIDGSQAALEAALWVVDEAVSRDIPVHQGAVVAELDDTPESARVLEHAVGEARLRHCPLRVVTADGDSSDHAAQEEGSIQVRVVGQGRPCGDADVAGSPAHPALQDTKNSVLICQRHSA